MPGVPGQGPAREAGVLMRYRSDDGIVHLPAGYSTRRKLNTASDGETDCSWKGGFGDDWQPVFVVDDDVPLTCLLCLGLV